ncbi:hypothetical protein [Luteibacter sp.]|jgi:hypothetical protein|uniref:hypothetical protein n=1 Tax=Luteibacter sp. TaxID=1886636 RepID=UPI002F416D91
MLTILALVVGVVVLIAALRRRNRRPAEHAGAPLVVGAAAPGTDWRVSRDESPTMRQAIAVMSGHADVLQQLGDGWLVSANLKVREPATFRANVLHAQSLKVLINDECAALVTELRDLEHKRDSAALFDVRREQAHALADWAGVLNRALRDRLQALATERGLDMSALLDAAAKQGGRLDGGTVDAWLPRFSPGDFTIREVLP